MPLYSHVIASGPSVKTILNYDWSNKITIGCNGVGLLPIPLTAWCAVDIMPLVVVNWVNKQTIPIYSTNNNSHQFNKSIKVAHWGIQSPLPKERAKKDGLWWMGSSAMLACEIARVYYNAEKIAVYGLDYNNNEHAYDNIDNSLKRKEAKWDMGILMMAWDILKQTYKHYGVEVFNANLKSAIMSLPRIEQNVAWAEKFGINKFKLERP